MHEIEVDGKILSFQTTEQMYDYLKKHDSQKYEAFMQLKGGNVFKDEYEDLKISDSLKKEKEENFELVVDGVLKKFENQDEMDEFLNKKNKTLKFNPTLSKKSAIPTDPTSYNIAKGKNKHSPDIKEEKDDISKDNIDLSSKKHKLTKLSTAKGFESPSKMQKDVEDSEVTDTKKNKEDMRMNEFEQEMQNAPEEIRPYLGYLFEQLTHKKKIKKIELVQKFSTCPEEEVFSFLNYIKNIRFIQIKKQFVLFGDEIYQLNA
jgi:hypothetical protein